MVSSLYDFQQYTVDKFAELNYRFWSKVDFGNDMHDCWLWTGAKDSSGYGSFVIKPKVVGAHQVSYIFLIGNVPDGKELHHKCEVRNCVNAFYHIVPVTHEENMTMSRRTMDRLANKTSHFKSFCKNGHALDGPNTYVDTRGQRGCRQCRKDAVTRYRSRLKGVI